MEAYFLHFISLITPLINPCSSYADNTFSVLLFNGLLLFHCVLSITKIKLLYTNPVRKAANYSSRECKRRQNHLFNIIRYSSGSK